ncbi:DUF5655 domain-containing protein [Amycolatopsis nalaikhensis]|uniref:DUF5655 domain-containing protein n=1 Tax=Amycolatopsis nalaikhensis TaxID=715472 RepID=A0ABY8XFI6_9PSEU|nr:DUF5655 domain-containing protein [Amycolatopsis sp. 2-2]WIV54361.1 DUF5655 domain-containing protein [Amycolatopsis sp. 2-2]
MSAILDGMPTRWTCPRCDREFARAGQGHTCVPGCTVEDTFAGKPPWQREVYDAVLEHVHTLGDVHEDAVKVGVFLKREHKLAELRPRSRDVLVYLWLPHPVTTARIAPAGWAKGARVGHKLSLRGVSDVDDEVRDWFTLAFETS